MNDREIQLCIELGIKYPYDGKEHENMTVDTKAALGILADLTDRSGIAQAFHRIDPDVRSEIVESMSAIIRTAQQEPTA